MKTVVILLVGMFGIVACRAQSDIEVMIKQILLLEVHIEELKKAIDIARAGLTTINDIRHGEFNLHNVFFRSLQQVSPSVAKYSKIAAILADEALIIQRFRTLIKESTGTGGMTSRERLYIIAVYTNLSDECGKKLDELTTVLTPGELTMTDDERLRRIDGIYTDMTAKKVFTQQFTSHTAVLIKTRDQQKADDDLLKSIE